MRISVNRGQGILRSRCHEPAPVANRAQRPSHASELRRLRDGGGRYEQPRQVDDENAPLRGEIPRIDPTMVGFHAPPAEGKAEPETGSVRASLLERVEQIVRSAGRETAAPP